MAVISTFQNDGVINWTDKHTQVRFDAFLINISNVPRHSTVPVTAFYDDDFQEVELTKNDEVTGKQHNQIFFKN